MVSTNIGTSILVALGSPVTYDQSGYEAMSFAACGNVTQLDEIGGKSDVSSYDDMSDGITRKLPGTTNYGSSSIKMAFNKEDFGQLVLANGFDGANKGLEHSFAIVDSSGSAIWFTSRIFSFAIEYGSTGDIIMSSVNIEINSTLTASDSVAVITEPDYSNGQYTWSDSFEWS